MSDPVLLFQGADESNLSFVKRIVIAHPGHTSNELEKMFPSLGDGKLRKRLADLAKAGYIAKGESRKSTVSGSTGATWVPVLETAAA